MSDSITPLFTSTYSLGSGSLLTLDEPGKAKPGAPISVFDLAKNAGLTDVALVEERFGGHIAAYKAADKAGVKLCFGIKLVICSNLDDKTPESHLTESKIIIFASNSDACSDLIRIWNRAWTTGHYTYRENSYGRIDWGTLCALWTDRLLLALPFFSSFLAANTLSFNRIIPSIPRSMIYPLIVFREVDSQLPFAPLIDAAIDAYLPIARAEGITIEESLCKTVYYDKASSFRSYILQRARGNRTSWDKPNVNHLSSDRFSMQSYLEAEAARQARLTLVG